METERLPWLLALLTAGWFGWMANRMSRNWILWAVGGAAFGLVISTLVLGLGDATSIPFSDHARKVSEIKWAAAAVLAIGVIGWMLTAGLHRHHHFVWRKLTAGSASAGSTPVAATSQQGSKSSPAKSQ
jgi:hypothetical protein